MRMALRLWGGGEVSEGRWVACSQGLVIGLEAKGGKWIDVLGGRIDSLGNKIHIPDKLKGSNAPPVQAVIFIVVMLLLLLLVFIIICHISGTIRANFKIPIFFK